MKVGNETSDEGGGTIEVLVDVRSVPGYRLFNGYFDAIRGFRNFVDDKIADSAGANEAIANGNGSMVVVNVPWTLVTMNPKERSYGNRLEGVDWVEPVVEVPGCAAEDSGVSEPGTGERQLYIGVHLRIESYSKGQ